MYFNFIKKINYAFNGVSHQVKNIFSRPIVTTNKVTSIRIDNENTPDKSALNLYDDPNLYYINALINNITDKQLWPVSQLEFSEQLESVYGGYAIHILETPSVTLKKGDIIVLNNDLGQCDAGDIDCWPTYGLVETWDPVLRKLWIKNFAIGSTSLTTESNFFKDNVRFKIFQRDSDSTINDLDGVPISNETAFRSDPNYTFEANVFTMKRVSKYIDSAHSFSYSSDIVTTINPLQTNFSVDYSSDTSVFDSFVGEYSSGNTNGTCSLLDAYILEHNGQTGTDGTTYDVDYRFISTTFLNYITLENENERYIYAANRDAIPKIIDDIERQLNA